MAMMMVALTAMVAFTADPRHDPELGDADFDAKALQVLVAVAVAVAVAVEVEVAAEVLESEREGELVPVRERLSERESDGVRDIVDDRVFDKE